MKNIMDLPLTIVFNSDFAMAENQVPGTKNPPTRWSQFKFCLFQPDWYSGFLLPLNPSNKVLYYIHLYIYIYSKKTCLQYWLVHEIFLQYPRPRNRPKHPGKNDGPRLQKAIVIQVMRLAWMLMGPMEVSNPEPPMVHPVIRPYILV